MIKLKKIIKESFFKQGRTWFMHEGLKDISVIFENGKKLTFELTFRDKMGENKNKWKNQAVNMWSKIAREIYKNPELNEYGNTKDKSWEECFSEALKDVRMKPYIKPLDRTPVFPQ